MYTRAGDKGKTSLTGGQVVSKANLRVSCYGTLDELNAWVGEIRAQRSVDKELDGLLGKIQRDLFSIGAVLANPEKKSVGREIDFHAKEEIVELEVVIDRYAEKLPPLTQFILPGGSKVASFFHIARTVTRRAERLLVALAEQESVDEGYIAYLNRLSSAFFVFARHVNFRSDIKEEVW